MMKSMICYNMIIIYFFVKYTYIVPAYNEYDSTEIDTTLRRKIYKILKLVLFVQIG